MVDFDYVQELLPIPVRVHVCFEHYDYMVKQLSEQLKQIKTEHNKGKEFPVNFVLLDYDSPEWCDDINRNEYKIFIGSKQIQSFTGDPSNEELSYIWNLISQIPNAVKGVLDAWHDEIVALQKINAEKIRELEEQKYDEVLYAYYHIINDKKAFLYLKRLAERYPNSKYCNRLRRIYRVGLKNWHEQNLSLAYKLAGNDSEKFF